MTEQLEQEIRRLRSLFWSDRDPEGLAFAPLADAYRRAGQLRQAVELLANGRVRHPDFATGHVVAARLFMEKGLLEEGELAARRALELDEDNILALGLLADALEARGGTLDAQSLRSRVNELAPDEPTDAEGPVVDIAELAPDEPMDVEEPVADIAELAPDEPEDTEESGKSEETSDFEDDGMLVTRTLADLYARQGFTAEALEVYRQLLEIDPQDEDLRRKVMALESGPEGETGVEPPVEKEGESPEGAALEDTEPVEHVWQTQADAEGHDVDTPFAWIGEESEESAAAGPPISEYFQRLLAWEPGASDTGAGGENQPEGPGSGGSGDELTTRTNEDGP